MYTQCVCMPLGRVPCSCSVWVCMHTQCLCISLPLALVCLLPEILRNNFAIPVYFGGTSVLIVVSVTMDTIQQIQSHLLAHQYEGLIEKSQLRGRNKKRTKRGPARR